MTHMQYTTGHSVQELFSELTERARNEGVRTFEEYRTLIDALIEEEKCYGYLDDDEDIAQIHHDLEMKWPEMEKELGIVE